MKNISYGDPNLAIKKLSVIINILILGEPMSDKEIFLSHSSKDTHGFNALFEYLQDIGVEKDQVLCSSVIGAGFVQGTKWKNAIKRSVNECNIFLALYTNNYLSSHICQKEFGMAIAEGKEVFYVNLTGREPQDTFLQDLHGGSATEPSLAQFCDDLLGVLKRSSPSAAETSRASQRFIEKISTHDENEISGPVLVRGELFDDLNIIDATFYLKEGKIGDPLKAIQQHVASRLPLPTKLQYLTAAGADRWVKLCKDRDYQTFRSSLTFLESHIQEIVESIGAKAIISSPDFISLGPGDGRKDEIILRKMIDYRNQISEDRVEWFYYPYDISIDLLRTSITNITSTDQIRESLKIKAICADFDAVRDFKPVFDYRKETNVFSLLGNTLGNMSNETEFLALIRSTMNADDFFLLEVRLHGDGDFSIPGGSEENRKRFNFSPLEFLGVAYSPTKLRYGFQGAPFSSVDGARSLIGSYGPYQFKGKNYTTQLCCINFYDMDRLGKVLDAVGFNTIWRDKSDDNTVGMYLLKTRND